MELVALFVVNIWAENLFKAQKEQINFEAISRLIDNQKVKKIDKKSLCSQRAFKKRNC